MSDPNINPNTIASITLHHVTVPEPIQEHRPFLISLFFEKDGSLNTAQFVFLLLALTGIVGFIFINILCKDPSVIAKVASWSWLGATSMAVLIGSLPLAKAKILAKSHVPAEVAHSIASSALGSMQSTDLQEGYVAKMTGVDVPSQDNTTDDIQ